MKKIALILLSALFFVGCSTAPQAGNVNVSTANSNDSAIVSSHSEIAGNSAQNSMVVPKSETKTKWTQSGTPIDVSAYDVEIAKAEKDLKANAKDETAKNKLSEAYTKRGVALTEARQYASALGDYRRALKYAPNAEAKSGMDSIIGIYNSMNRESPPEGEEPPPLPIVVPSKINPKTSSDKISFEKGANSEIVTGKLLNLTDSKSFIFNVKQGQTVRTEQILDKDSLNYITVEISDSTGKYMGDSDASCNNRKEFKAPTAGDYRISVTECLKANQWSGDFKLKVSAE